MKSLSKNQQFQADAAKSDSAAKLSKAAKDSEWPFVESFDSYESAVDSLKSWVKARTKWMDGNG